MPASTKTIRLPGPAALLLALLLCLPVPCAASGDGPVPGVAVEVRNHEGDFVGANLIDGDPATAWVGGGTGIGPGKWIEFRFPGPVRLSGLKVANGHQGSGRFDAFRRLARGVILYPDGVRQKFTLKPEPGVQTIRLEPKIAQGFRVIITGVAPGAGDTAMGGAKVAVSEMTVIGELVDPSLAAQAMETAAAPAEKPLPADKPAPKHKEPKRAESGHKPAAQPAPAAKAKTKAETKAVPAKPAPAQKAVPAKKTASVARPEPEKRTAPAKETASTPAKRQVAENIPKTAAKTKRQSSKSQISASKGKKSTPKAANKDTQRGATFLRPVAEIPADKPLDMGRISPWLDLELVAGIKRYFSHLTTLSDSYPEVFAAGVRERERAAFLALQERVRRDKGFADHHLAMPELIGLSFDRPEASGGGVAIRVHGPCRYYVGDRGYEFRVDSVVTMVREGGVWLISGVRDK